MSPIKIFIALALSIFFVSLTFYLIEPKKELESKVNDQPLRPSSAFPQTETPVSPATESITPVEKPRPDLTKEVFIEVPFTVQAPLLEWADPHFQDACEEASALMAMKWVLNKKFGTKPEVRNEILAISTWQTEKFSSYHDTSAQDTVERIFKGYFGYQEVSIKKNISSEDIISELEIGNIVITPMNGQALKNPFFTQPGPERHMVLIKGYDPEMQEFITNDPGVSQGESYRYPINVFMNAIRDYPTGDHVPIPSTERNGIIVTKSKP
jgi:hypothetical protein